MGQSERERERERAKKRERERDYDLGSLDADAAVGQVGEEAGGHRHGRVLEPAKHRASALRDPKEINNCLDFPDLVSDNELLTL